MTHIQEIQNHLELAYKQPRDISKRFQKDISPRTKDIKQFGYCKQTDAQTGLDVEQTPLPVGSAKKTNRYSHTRADPRRIN